MKKRLLAWVAVLALVLTLSPTYAAENSDELYAVEPDAVEWVTNEDGIAETQEIFSLPSDGSLPSYIESIEYFDDTDTFEDDPFFDVIPVIDGQYYENEGIQPLALTQNEKEPNNTYSQANTYTLGSDMYGAISTTSDHDFYKVIFGRDGKAEFYLHNIPPTCNYNMKIYSQAKSGGSLTLYRTLATNYSFEKVSDLPVEYDKVYYIEVYSSSGSSNTNYQLQVSFTPIDDTFEPNNTFSDAKPVSKSGYYYGSIHKLDDVDFYVVSTTSGILDILLSDIPVSCNYHVAVFDSNQKQIAATTVDNTSSKTLNVAVGSGKYYVKVYSKSGYNQAKNYTLVLSNRTAFTTIRGTVKPSIRQSGGSNEVATAIANLPVKILCTKRGSSTQYVLGTVTTNSLGEFTAQVSLPSDANKLYVSIYPVTSTLAIQLADGTVPTLVYEIPYNSSSVTINIGNSDTVTSQLLVSMSLWRMGINGLAEYSRNSSRTRKQLVVRCTYNGEKGTNATADRIQISGNTGDIDWYDYDVFLHELGHWVMSNNGGVAYFTDQEHYWELPSSPGCAYNEGWASYFSCAMRNNSEMKDYSLTAGYFGGRLSDGRKINNGNYSPVTVQNPYEKNASVEINIAASMWNLASTNGKKYSDMENIMVKHFENWKDFYTSYMATVSGSQLKDAWEVCEKFHVAYDLDVPKVTLSVSGLTASLNATDNVAISKYELYIDGVLKKTETGNFGTGTSMSIDLSTYSLTSGSHTVECRVYDLEGVASGVRPRTARYGSASRSFVVSGTSAASDNDSSLAVYGLSSYTLPVGGELLYKESVPAHMNLSICFASTGAIKAITVIKPNGEIYAELPYIAPDAPYTINDADPGEWSVLVTNYTVDELYAMAEEQDYTQEEIDETEFPDVDMSLIISATPTPVELVVPSVTDDPYILAEFFGDSDVIVSENGQCIDPTAPLMDGVHTLTVTRRVGDMLSSAVDYTVCVDTTAPTVILEAVSVTERDRFALTATFSEDILDMTVNGTPIDWGTRSRSEITEWWLLEPGENEFIITATDFAGNTTSQTISVTRTTN